MKNFFSRLLILGLAVVALPINSVHGSKFSLDSTVQKRCCCCKNETTTTNSSSSHQDRCENKCGSCLTTSTPENVAIQSRIQLIKHNPATFPVPLLITIPEVSSQSKKTVAKYNLYSPPHTALADIPLRI